MEHNLLQELTSARDDWIIKVRVVRMWDAFTTQDEKEPLCLEMILLDEMVSILKNPVLETLFM